MAQFTRRATQPLTPSGYRRIAKQLREAADTVNECADGVDAMQRVVLNQTLRTLDKRVQSWYRRHQQTIKGES